MEWSIGSRDNWQASISIETQQGNQPATEAEARDIATRLGWEVTGEDDAENGQWIVTIAECDMAELAHTGYVERRVALPWGTVGVLIVDAGEVTFTHVEDTEPEKDMDGTFYHPPDEGEDR